VYIKFISSPNWNSPNCASPGWEKCSQTYCS